MDNTEKIVALGIGVLLGLIIWAVVNEQNEWDDFKQTHNCKIVSQVSGSTFNTFGVDGKGYPTVGVGTIPSKTGYLCNDGITYFR